MVLVPKHRNFKSTVIIKERVCNIFKYQAPHVQVKEYQLIPLSSNSKPIAGEKKVLKNRFLKYITIYKYIYN
jgi:hypothetical protein